MTENGSSGRPEEWLLLLHHLPARPLYLRAMVLRRLRALGALPVKNSSYLLPDRGDIQEDLQWLLQEVAAQGGAAWIFRVKLVAGLDDRSVREAFSQLQEPAYGELAREAAALEKRVARLTRRSAPETRAAAAAAWKALAARIRELDRIAYFGGRKKQEVDTIMDRLQQVLFRRAEAPLPDASRLADATWVTRRGIKVDRLATAWLIRRFISATCPIRFVDPDTYRHSPGEIRFDMFEGEFTHVGARCTFEVLLDTIRPSEDTALRAIAEMVHDIDCKDDRFRRPETAGLAVLIEGLTARHAGDEARLADGLPLFDSLYARFRS